jgi:TatD DNase family protein
MLLDFHCHHPAALGQGLSIRSFHQGEREEFGRWEGPCSVGLHPWLVGNHDFERDQQWDWLNAAARQENVLMLGECGLDRLRGPELIYQEAVFETCLMLAERLKKPLVIHCVKAFSELLALVKRHQVQVPLVLHGFNRKPDLMHTFLDAGFYFSFGAAILHPASAAVLSLSAVPLDRFFLETDTQLIDVNQVYQAAAVLRGLEQEELEARIWANWLAVRGM